MKTEVHTKTLKVRIKDKHAPMLNRMATGVNLVWNYVNELSFRSVTERNDWLSDFDIQKYTKGASNELGLSSTTIQAISKEYVTRRIQFHKIKLNWRKSGGSKRSLGWIPFKKGAAKWHNGQIKFLGHNIGVWDSFGLSQYEFRSGTFAEDAQGRWYFNIVIQFKPKKTQKRGQVGIDLGCKTAITDSNGGQVTGRHFRKLEPLLAKAQRAKKKLLAQNLNAKIKNRRKDELHKYTSKIVQQNQLVVVGNVSSKAMAKTNMAKSALDAGWGMTKTMLEYKCAFADIVFEEVNEKYTTQTCSCCGIIPASSPKGRADLGIREWTCDSCGTAHNRDINAAMNILALGHERLAGGIPRL